MLIIVITSQFVFFFFFGKASYNLSISPSLDLHCFFCHNIYVEGHKLIISGNFQESLTFLISGVLYILKTKMRNVSVSLLHIYKNDSPFNSHTTIC